MKDIDRRRALAYSAAALTATAISGVANAAPAASTDEPASEPNPTNPMAARTSAFTVVTPDMDASIRFYCDGLDYEVLGRGVLEGRAPTVRGVGGPGRRYALLKMKGVDDLEYGIIRLLEAPRGARANRPRGQAAIMDTGMAVMEIMSRDTAASHAKLTALGLQAISKPLFYYRPKIKPLPGSRDQFANEFEIFTYSGFAPGGGEQLFLSQGVKRDEKPFPPWRYPNLHSPIGAATLMSADRWPIWHFYKDVFGLSPTKDQYSYHPHKDFDVENINILLGAPPGTYYRFGGLGDGMGLEWYEFRQWEPPKVPPYPTELDRTGLAMITVTVDNPALVRANLRKAGIALAGEGVLPLPGRPRRQGFYVRGPIGELIEVVGRRA